MRVLLILLAALTLGACTIQRVTAYERPAVSHVVFFDLKDPGDAAELIADCERDLPSLTRPGLFHCGRHLDTGRASVDGGYDVGLVMQFLDLPAYRAFLEHPKHKALAEKWKPRWDSMHVYDIGR